MKTLIKTSVFLISLFCFTNGFSQTKSTATKSIAVVTISEISSGAFGSNFKINISYDDGKSIDGLTLIPNYKKGKFTENYIYTAWILKYMEDNDYTLVTSNSNTLGTMLLWQYIYKK